MSYEVMPEIDTMSTVIKVIGVGGGGGNAVEHMLAKGARGIEFIAANTDHQALQRSHAHVNIQLGSTGLGAGAKPEIGAAAALEKREQIAEAIRDANLLFITAGMGGGTGTGAAPVIAEIAKELGILTVAVVTKPFSFEGGRRMRVAEQGIDNLKANVDSMIVILNEKLESECPKDATMKECFEMSNEVLYKACVGIAEIINTPGTINVDFEDLKTVMTERGTAIIGLATATGPDRARVAAEKAIASPLIEGANLQGARGLLVYFTGNESVTLTEIREAMAVLNTFVHRSAVVIFGSAIDESMGDEVRVTLVATGLDHPIDPSESRIGRSNVAFFDEQRPSGDNNVPQLVIPQYLGGTGSAAPVAAPAAEQPQSGVSVPAAQTEQTPEAGMETATPATSTAASAAAAAAPAASSAPAATATEATSSIPTFTIPAYLRK